MAGGQTREVKEACSTPRTGDWPTWSLAHLRRLTDGTAITEHALGAVPNAAEGYTLDDNARALVAVLRYHQRHRQEDDALELSIRYLSFLVYCQTEDGWFHNDVGWDRRFLDERAAEDPVGRAVWAMGEAVALYDVEAQWVAAARTLERTLPWTLHFTNLRPMAFSLLGLRALLRAPRGRVRPEWITFARSAAARLGERLLEAYQQARGPGWMWFEDRITYSNARLPMGLVAAWEITGRRRYLRAAVETYDFLWGHLWNGRHLAPVGNRDWWERGRKPAAFDQQPIDAGGMAELGAAFFEATGAREYLTRAVRSLEWFYGRNALGLPIHDRETGGCRDGLGADGVNANEGAESTLAHLLARMAVEEALRRADARTHHTAMA